MSYLRLTPAEYRAVRRECLYLDLARASLTAFRRRLVGALSEASPALAGKVAGLKRSQLRLLLEHFQAPVEAPRAGIPGLTSDEWAAFTEACVSYPLPVRFVGLFRHMLVDLFREVSPGLARKLEGLTGQQFEVLYDQATERRSGPA